MVKTTVQIRKETLNRLKMFKSHDRESYDFLLNKLLDESEEETLTDEEIEEIQQALKEVKEGKVFPIEQVAKEFGVTLR